jgi:hypothetical protein
MPFKRDPLSERYDRPATQILRRAIEAFPADPKNPPWVRGIFDSPAGDPREVRSPQLTRHQRAFMRALYYNPLIYHRSPVKAWSLKVEWQQDTARIGGPSRRLFRIRVFNDTSGRRHAGRSAGSYVDNPALRSTAAVIRQERA